MISHTSIIVARYKENISWLQSLPDTHHVHVYNKFYQDINCLPNVGRESHTYLHHIIQNYNNLSQYNIFCQGNPIEHCPNFIHILSSDFKKEANQLSDGFYSLSAIVKEGPYANVDYRHPCGLPMFYLLQLMFDINMGPKDTYQTMYGGQFIVEKSNILFRPIAFYKMLYTILSFDTNPIEGFFMERLWPFIFNKNVRLSNKFIYLMNNLSL